VPLPRFESRSKSPESERPGDAAGAMEKRPELRGSEPANNEMNLVLAKVLVFLGLEPTHKTEGLRQDWNQSPDRIADSARTQLLQTHPVDVLFRVRVYNSERRRSNVRMRQDHAGGKIHN
jgi:hypothetical protein